MTTKIEENYQKIWKNIVKKDGIIDLEQLKKELFDFSFMIKQVPLIYSKISKGLLSKPHYYAHVLIEQLEKNFYDKEITQDDVLDMIKGCSDLEEIKKSLVDYFEIEKPTT
jgi:hypothetical protein